MATVNRWRRVRAQVLRRQFCRTLLATALWSAAGLPAVCAAAESFSEAAVKAAFLYRFAGYVQWPADAGSEQPFTIAVLQGEAVGLELQRFLPGHLVAGHLARVRLIKTIEELGDAQMLYVGPQPEGRLHTILAPIREKAVLVVTDDERGLQEGGMINFINVDQRIRFEVSLLASDRVGLKIGAELLSVAARVEGGRLRSEAVCVPKGVSDEVSLQHCPLRFAAR